VSTDRIAALRTKVQQLANKLHEAKRELDWVQYTWLHLDNPGTRARMMESFRQSPNSPFERDLERKATAYRRARQAYIAAKAELDELTEQRRIDNRIRVTRNEMRRQFAPPLQEAAASLLVRGENFDITRRPKLIQAMAESVQTAVQQMRTERSMPSVVAVVETLAAVDQMGFDTVRPSERRQALDAAKQCAIALRDRMRKQINPAVPKQRERLNRAEALVQYLSG